MISGVREELVSSGAAAAWHDMVLHLIARYAGSAAAQDIARLFALQWPHEGLTPYIVFDGRRDHGDADIESAQQWLSKHFSVANPVEEMLKRSKLAKRPSSDAS
jgi:transcriptional regulator GlxA family with amidase domain